MKKTLRQIKSSELPLITSLEKLCFSEPWSENALNIFHKNGAYIVIAEENGVPVGYAVLDLIAADFAELMRIAVHPESRGQGYSCTLMQAAVDKARECGKDRVLLEVREGNLPAIALYRKFSFKTDGVRKNYYRNPIENGILMSLDLN